MNTQQIGEKIRRARFARGKLWTQKKLAEQAGLSQGYISAIERGEEFPSLKALTKISEVLDWPLAYFIDPMGEGGDGTGLAIQSDQELSSATSNGRDPQLRQALAMVIRAGLDGAAPSGLSNEAVKALIERLAQLETRVAMLEKQLTNVNSEPAVVRMH